MISYDTRVLLVMLVLSLVIFTMSKTKWQQVGTVFKFIMLFLCINLIAIFFFSPGQGTKIYGTETPLWHLFGHYTLTKEQLFYEFNVMLKYLTVIPAVFINQTACRYRILPPGHRAMSSLDMLSASTHRPSEPRSAFHPPEAVPPQ